ncbi:MAG: tRNA (guanosine(46)-N7)-methyltransferase TrmB, partial [Marinilabiliales bacterium]|nr:tRNA (guanosine(46)-N7)-methyltransferase TrmB [Marinilabiliales bacterium]
RTYVEMLPSFFAPGEVSEIWITFPDPQMKKRRKRLTSTTLLGGYGKFLRQGGLIHLKTDSDFLYQYTTSLIHLNGFGIEAETDDLYASPFSDEIMGIKTYYEKQWLARGIKIKYLRYVPRFLALSEPETEPEFDNYRSFGRTQRSQLLPNG